jgi:acid stress-induced BolA-like protein IbaG/YrbA
MKTESIKETILEAIPDAEVYVVDPNNDGEHFESIVISESFNGLMLVKQHQMVMKALKERFSTDVHALALKTFTPEKWKTEKSSYTIN